MYINILRIRQKYVFSDGKFLLFKPKHHLTVISVLKSKNFLLPARLKEVCLNFYISIGHIASKRRSEKSLPKLKGIF